MECGWSKVKQGKKWSLCSTSMSSHPHFFITQSLGLSSVSPSALYLISLASATKAHLILRCTSFPFALCSDPPLVFLGSGSLGPACFLRGERESGRCSVPGSLSSSSGLSKHTALYPFFPDLLSLLSSMMSSVFWTGYIFSDLPLYRPRGITTITAR